MKLSEKGFSLVQVVLATGLMGGVALGFMQMMKTVNQVQMSSVSRSDELELRTSIKMILDNRDYCTVSMEGLTFRKENIDFGNVEVEKSSNFTSASEGLDVELWYSNIAGDTRTKKKLNGKDNISGTDRSQFGKISIESVKLVMFNGPTACPDNYCDTDTRDIGQLVVVYEKKISQTTNRTSIMTFPLYVNFTSVGGNSTITSCETVASASGIFSGSYSNVTASRAYGTTYQNLTTRPRLVMVMGRSTSVLNQKYISGFVDGVKVVDVDSSGRLLIPKDLFLFAKLNKEVVLSSSVNMIEIWDKEDYEISVAETLQDFDKLTEDVMGINSSQKIDGIS